MTKSNMKTSCKPVLPIGSRSKRNIRKKHNKILLMMIVSVDINSKNKRNLNKEEHM